MEPFGNWEEVAGSTSKVPLPHEDFDDYFGEYNQMDNLLNETLIGIQDLDVPSGFMNNDIKQQEGSLFPRGHQAKHSRKISGTAIFGYADHNKELSISGITDLYKSMKGSVDIGKSISPGELLKSLTESGQAQASEGGHELLQNSDFKFPQQQPAGEPLRFLEEDEIEYEKAQKKQEKGNDYIVTNNNPKSYKFPPSPTLSKRNESYGKSQPTYNNYSAKYLQEISMLNGNSNDNGSNDKNIHSKSSENPYVDDIGPLLDDEQADEVPRNDILPLLSTPFNTRTVYRYVPIPVTENVPFKPTKKPQRNQDVFGINDMPKTYLPPPSPSALSAGSPELKSSPEPQSPTPRNDINFAQPLIFSSPINPQLLNNKNDFFTPQFFSDDVTSRDFDDDKFNYNLNSSPVYQKTSAIPSPFRYNSSPIRNFQPTNDDTVDANTTLTPQKNSIPITPKHNKVTLEWSPIISPNAKSSKDVKRAIQQSSPRRKIKKTSLLPPGELDQYWVGPDENKIFTCVYQGCGKRFTRRYNVRSHIQTNLSDRPFGCSYCPKRFVRQHDLNRHVKGHLEARYCKCLCGKEFSRLDALKKHRARNICIGGLASNENHCVTKPPRKEKGCSIDEKKAEILAEEAEYLLPMAKANGQ